MNNRDGTEPLAQKKQKVNPSEGSQSSSPFFSRSTTHDEEMETDEVQCQAQKKVKGSEKNLSEEEKRLTHQLEETEKRAKELEKELGAARENEEKMKEDRDKFKKSFEAAEIEIDQMEAKGAIDSEFRQENINLHTKVGELTREKLQLQNEIAEMHADGEKIKEDRDNFKKKFQKCCIEARSSELRAEFAEGALEKMAEKGANDSELRKENIELHMKVGELTKEKILLQKEIAEKKVDGDKTLEDKLKHLRSEVEQLRKEKKEWNKRKIGDAKDHKKKRQEKKMNGLKTEESAESTVKNGAGASIASRSDVSAAYEPPPSVPSPPSVCKASDPADELEVMQIECDKWRNLLEKEMNTTQRLESELDEAQRKLDEAQRKLDEAQRELKTRSLEAESSQLRLRIHDLEKSVQRATVGPIPQQFAQPGQYQLQPGFVQPQRHPQPLMQLPHSYVQQQLPLQHQQGVGQQHLQPLQHPQQSYMQQLGQPPTAAPSRPLQQLQHQPQQMQQPPPFYPFSPSPMSPQFPR